MVPHDPVVSNGLVMVYRAHGAPWNPWCQMGSWWPTGPMVPHDPVVSNGLVMVYRAHGAPWNPWCQMGSWWPTGPVVPHGTRGVKWARGGLQGRIKDLDP